MAIPQAGVAGQVAAPQQAAKPEIEPYRRRKVQLRSSVTVLLFAAGLTAGIGAVGIRMQAPAPAGPTDSFPALARSAVEPLPALAVAQNLSRNDVHGLAQLVDSDTLTAIQNQLTPLVSIEQVTFVGSTILGTDTIAGYVVRGRDNQGNLGIVGLTIRVRNGQVVAQ